ncbi:MAG: methyltransferase [Candidatus Eisenbacteria bacterium RBG_16_71_46]|nr:MAG: methyltransferase [Candidatus Eisenbacteria bacterium RBG_16_71_46]
MKQYDRAYFDRWYHSPRRRVRQRELLARKVRLAVAATEYLLDRPLRTVLDVGCGEGAWQPRLERLRPGVRYLGIDSSEYAVARFGRRRNLRLGSVGELGRLGLRGPFDLVVCSDVLHYVPTPELRRGLKAMARLLGGMAFIEVFTREDETVGDSHGEQRRGAAAYRRLFREAGLTRLGLFCFVGRALADTTMSFERA